MKIPDYKKIINNPEPWRVDAYKFLVDREKVWVNKTERTQWTIPNDPDLLKKLSISKSDRILFIAGYYGTWANAISKEGPETTYNDLSPSLVKFAKKTYQNNPRLKFLQTNYATIPNTVGEYDWTVSFEPISARSGLLLAVLRGLMNEKGIKIIHFPRKVVPKEKFENLKIIAKAYGCEYERKKIFIEGMTNKFIPLQDPHLITIIRTTPQAQLMAKKDIRALENEQYDSEDVAKRLSQIAPAFLEKYSKEIKKDNQG